ncbi:hypothetical protein Tco_0673621 [Tanacetum coccineum]
MAALKYKDDHNKIAYLGRERGCENFTDIHSYLDPISLVTLCLMPLRSCFDSLVKQFWATVLFAQNAAGSHDLVAIIDGREVMRVIGYRGWDSYFSYDPFISAMEISRANTIYALLIEAHLYLTILRFPLLGNQNKGEAAVLRRPPFPLPTIPETEWVVPNPVSPVTDWRPWPDVPVHSPIRDPTPEPVSPPTPPAQTFIFEEPLVFGPEPRPAGYVDPDPEDLDYIILMEDDTTHDGFHVESPVQPDDAPTPMPMLLGGDAILTLVSRVKKLEKTVKQLRETRLVVDASAAAWDVDIQDDIDLDGYPVWHYSLGHESTDVPSEDVEDNEMRRRGAQARNALEEEQLVSGLVIHGYGLGFGSGSLANVSKEREKELDDLMILAWEADVKEENFISAMNAVKEKEEASLGRFTLSRTQGQRVERVSSQPASVPAATTLPADDPDSAGGGSSNPAGSATPMAGSAASNTVVDSVLVLHFPLHPSKVDLHVNVSTDQLPIAVLFESTSGDINEFFLESDAEEQIGMSRVVADPDSDDEVLAEIIFKGNTILVMCVVCGKLPDDEIVDPRFKVETTNVSESALLSRSESERDDDMENFIPPSSICAIKAWDYELYDLGMWNMLCRHFILMTWKTFGVPQDDWMDVVVGGNIIQTVQAGLRQAYECIASAPMCYWKLLFFDVVVSFDSAVHRVHAVSFDAAAGSGFYAAAAYFVSAAPQSSCFAKIYLETWN